MRIVDSSRPVNWQHPLCFKLRHWWMGLPNPGFFGGLKLNDLVSDWYLPNHGTFSPGNRPQWSLRANSFPSLFFPNGSRVVLDNHAAVDRHNCTISACIRMHEDTGWKNLFRPGIQSSSWHLATFNLGLQIRTAAGNNSLLSPETSLQLGKWHAVALTLNADPLQEGWIDGLYAGYREFNLTQPSGAYGIIGNQVDSASGGAPFRGDVRCVLTHDRVLTRSEILALTDEIHAGFPNMLNWLDIPPGLVTEYPFTEVGNLAGVLWNARFVVDERQSALDWNARKQVSHYRTTSEDIAVPENLVGWWPFSGTAEDATENNRDWSGSPNYTDGLVGDAFHAKWPWNRDLISQDQVVTSGSFSVAFWYFAEEYSWNPSDPNYGPLDEQIDVFTQGGAPTLYIPTQTITIAPNSGAVVCRLRPDGPPLTYSSPSGLAGVWHHLAITYDHGLERARMYHDGTLVSENTVLADFGDGSGRITTLGGRRNEDWVTGHDGIAIDMMGMWNAELSYHQISQLYSAGFEHHGGKTTWRVQQRVVQNADLQWNSREIVQYSSQFIWRALQAVDVYSVLRWHLRQQLVEHAQLLYSLRQRLSQPSSLFWGAREAVADSISLVHHSRAGVGLGQQIPFAARALVRELLTALYGVRECCGQQSEILWNNRLLLDCALSLLYHQRMLTQAGSQLNWRTLETISDLLVVLYGVRQHCDKQQTVFWNSMAALEQNASLQHHQRMVVQTSQQLDWQTRERMAVWQQLPWGTRVATTVSSVVPWLVRQLVLQENQLTWAMRGLSPASGVLLWMDRQLVADSGNLRWKALSLGSVAVDAWLRWSAACNVHRGSGLFWSGRQLVQDSLALPWLVRESVADNGGMNWGVRSAAGLESEVLWGLREHLAADNQLGWGSRLVTGVDTLQNWRVRSAVGDNLSLLWFMAGSGVLLRLVLASELVRSFQLDSDLLREPVLDAELVRQAILDSELMPGITLDSELVKQIILETSLKQSMEPQ